MRSVSPVLGSVYRMRLWWLSSVSSWMRIPVCRNASTAITRSRSPGLPHQTEAAVPWAGLVAIGGARPETRHLGNPVANQACRTGLNVTAGVARGLWSPVGCEEYAASNRA